MGVFQQMKQCNTVNHFVLVYIRQSRMKRYTVSSVLLAEKHPIYFRFTHLSRILFTKFASFTTKIYLADQEARTLLSRSQAKRLRYVLCTVR